MSLCQPEAVLQALVTKHENKAITYQFASLAGPPTTEDLVAMMMAVVRHVQQHQDQPIPLPTLFQESP